MVITPHRFEGQIIVDLLSGAGVSRRRQFTDSGTALHHLASESVSVVMISLDAEPMEGLAWVRALRRDSAAQSRKAAVFMLARTLTRSVAESCRRAGANAVIGMPVSNATLLNTIQKVLARPRPFVEEAGYVGPCRRAGIVTAGAGSRRRSDAAAA